MKSNFFRINLFLRAPLHRCVCACARARLSIKELSFFFRKKFHRNTKHWRKFFSVSLRNTLAYSHHFTLGWKALKPCANTLDLKNKSIGGTRYPRVFLFAVLTICGPWIEYKIRFLRILLGYNGKKAIKRPKQWSLVIRSFWYYGIFLGRNPHK